MMYDINRGHNYFCLCFFFLGGGGGRVSSLILSENVDDLFVVCPNSVPRQSFCVYKIKKKGGGGGEKL